MLRPSLCESLVFKKKLCYENEFNLKGKLKPFSIPPRFLTVLLFSIKVSALLRNEKREIQLYEIHFQNLAIIAWKAPSAF